MKSSRSIQTRTILILAVFFGVAVSTALPCRAENSGQLDPESIRLAIEDLSRTFQGRYPNGDAYLERLDALLETPDSPERTEQPFNPTNSSEPFLTEELIKQLGALQREALLANPLLDFDRLLLIQRGRGDSCLPSNNAYVHEAINKSRPTEIVLATNLRGEVALESLYAPETAKTLIDMDLDFDASRVMFSAAGENGRWHLWEMDVETNGVHRITELVDELDYYDSCYMPDGRIMFISNAVFQGLPCESGRKQMGCLFRLDPSTGEIRQMAFEQDSDWCPTVLNNGRVMYLRWEYSDLPHFFSRILFSANPDGTNQAEHYGSGSFWPNSLFYAQPIPGHSSQFVGIATGHHVNRSGKLILFDPALGRHEADGAIQMMPGRERPVEPTIADHLYGNDFPKFLHPMPLGTGPDDGAGKYFLASGQLTKDDTWGIYLVDAFDNVVPLVVDPDKAFLEPIPLAPRVRPPVMHDRTDYEQDEAVVFITDVYEGPGLKNIPRGTVKSLRLYTYHFCYPLTGHNDVVGIESGWDIKRVLGTVPVEEDGSASFRIPSSTPIAIQPLDEQGQALQLMRSWTLGLPGELVSCVGCHESQNDVTPNRPTLAARRMPSPLQSRNDPDQGFSFIREVQPVLDEYCIGCHDGAEDHSDRPDFKSFDYQVVIDGKDRTIGPFYQSYVALRPYVRSPGPESDIHMFHPMEYHASTSPLFQMLEKGFFTSPSVRNGSELIDGSKGHHGVQLPDEAWERLATWVDLNSPCFGTWTEAHQHWVNEVLLNWMRIDNEAQMESLARHRELRRQYQQLYANVDSDPEAFAETDIDMIERIEAFRAAHPPIIPVEQERPTYKLQGIDNWPFNASEAAERQLAAAPNGETLRVLDLSEGRTLNLRWIPEGQYYLGSNDGLADEFPPSVAEVASGFWISETEITNAQYSWFDPEHDSRYIDQQAKDHGNPGYPANGPNQPVMRISWDEANRFCNWAAMQIGPSVIVSLPSEVEWEWASRAGTNTPFWYGELDVDFSSYANLADAQVARFRWGQGGVDYMRKAEEVDDGQMIVCDVARYEPNAWGLYDMHGNVAEWTRSVYGSYPPNNVMLGDPGLQRRVVRGGSWRDWPERATASFRIPYQPYQKVQGVGFRIITH
jgi:formylglycine-generating enzyme required for sulfatase activity